MMIVGKDKQSEETKESKFKLHNRQVITEDGIALAQDKQEEEKIRIGREVAFREIESNKRNKNIQKKEKVSVHDPDNHYAVTLQDKLNKKTSKDSSVKTEIRRVKDKVSHQIEDLKDPRQTAKHSTSMFKKVKHTEENDMVFKDISNVTSFSVFNNPHHHTFSASSRWKDVHTGHVKDRANIYAVAEKEDIKKAQETKRCLSKSRSWSAKRQIISDSDQSQDKEKKFLNENSLNAENDVDKITDNKFRNVPWRRKETPESIIRSPSLNLVSITIIPSSTNLAEDNFLEPDMKKICKEDDNIQCKDHQTIEDLKECEYAGASNVANTNIGNHINKVEKDSQEVGTQDTSPLTKCEINVQSEKHEIAMFHTELSNNKNDEHDNQKNKEEFEDSEYEDDFSIGIDLSVGQENTSGKTNKIREQN